MNELVVHRKALGVLFSDAVDELTWFVCEELVVENSLNALLAVPKDVRALTLLELGQLAEADLDNAFLKHQCFADLATFLNENLVLTISIIESRLQGLEQIIDKVAVHLSNIVGKEALPNVVVQEIGDDADLHVQREALVVILDVRLPVLIVVELELNFDLMFHTGGKLLVLEALIN